MNKAPNSLFDLVLLEAIDLHQTFIQGNEELKVLQGINLKVNKGDFLAIIGPSGAGKSTLLHLLGFLMKPTFGKVLFQQEDPFRLPANNLAKFRNEKIGFLFQFHYLLPEFNALENVMIPLLIKGIKKREARVRAEALLSDLQLYNRRNHKIGELSAGERQRVALARAIVNDPLILLADEPTGNLDRNTAKHVLELLQNLNKKKKLTLIIVTHDEWVASYSNRLALLLNGKLVEKNNL